MEIQLWECLLLFLTLLPLPLYTLVATPHGATNIKMAIYDDENNAPKNIIEETAVISFTSPANELGIVSIPLSPTLLHPGNYWIMVYNELEVVTKVKYLSSTTSVLCYLENIPPQNAFPNDTSFIVMNNFPNEVFLWMNSKQYTRDEHVECAPFTWIDGQIYTESDTVATYTLTNAEGCDSIIVLNLTIVTIDTGITLSGTTITSQQTNASYQWIYCEDATAIDGANDISYTATENGKYAVVVTVNGCSDTSDCITISGIGIKENSENELISIYPNPTDGRFFVNLGVATEQILIKVSDINGKVLYVKEWNNRENIECSLDLPSGVYFVTMQTEQQTITRKLIKQ